LTRQSGSRAKLRGGWRETWEGLRGAAAAAAAAGQRDGDAAASAVQVKRVTADVAQLQHNHKTTAI